MEIDGSEGLPHHLGNENWKLFQFHGSQYLMIIQQAFAGSVPSLRTTHCLLQLSLDSYGGRNPAPVFLTVVDIISRVSTYFKHPFGDADTHRESAAWHLCSQPGSPALQLQSHCPSLNLTADPSGGCINAKFGPFPWDLLKLVGY